MHPILPLLFDARRLVAAISQPVLGILLQVILNTTLHCLNADQNDHIFGLELVGIVGESVHHLPLLDGHSRFSEACEGLVQLLELDVAVAIAVDEVEKNTQQLLHFTKLNTSSSVCLPLFKVDCPILIKVKQHEFFVAGIQTARANTHKSGV